MNALIKLLEHLEKRPGMYFGAGDRSRSIHLLQAFLLGVDCGRQYHAEPPVFELFTEWVATHYRVLAEGRDGFHMILEHVGGDDQKAYEEFFRLLPTFLHDKQQLGRDGILSRFSEAQDDALGAFEKELKNE
jgi:hypothetical protein